MVRGDLPERVPLVLRGRARRRAGGAAIAPGAICGLRPLAEIRRDRAALDALREFWTRELAGAPAVLALPLDVPRDLAGTNRGEREHFEIDPRLTKGLRALGAANDASLFMVMLSLYLVLLRIRSGASDLVVGSPISGRTSPDTESIVGFFANLLVLRARMRDGEAFTAHLARVRDTALACYDHQAPSFAQLVSWLNPERRSSSAPIVQVIFGPVAAAARRHARRGSVDRSGTRARPPGQIRPRDAAGR